MVQRNEEPGERREIAPGAHQPPQERTTQNSKAMSKQPPAEWMSVNEAAVHFGKSLSLIRRTIPEIEERAPEQVRREPIPHKGGFKLFLNRAYLVQLFGAKEPEPEPPGEQEESLPQGAAVAGLVEILERQLTAKDRQIENLQRDAEAKTRQIEEVTESLTKFAAINAGLQNQLLAARAGERPEPPLSSPQERPDSVLSSPLYFVALAVVLSLMGVLVLYLVLS